MDVDQLVSGIDSVVASSQSQNYCVIWCMTKSEWASWVQAGGSIIAIVVTFVIASLDSIRTKKAQRHAARDLRESAVAVMRTFDGAIASIPKRLKPDGNRSFWDVRLSCILLEAELRRADLIPLQALSLNEQKGLFAFRLAAIQIIEALRMVFPEIHSENNSVVVKQIPYDFLQKVIATSMKSYSEGHQLFSNPKG
ncbi:hypothetical protein [Delftia acidovorans]|uniref:Uncharacterized protein n=1 Tax=Delftia acidovorans TaxID=80866 RepID=A0AAJ2R3T7_DELAC|nr:hypothetical protein [Delftia acidovorans]MDX4955318.1 hypothetical protein [Delftia acidovorans]